MTDPRDRDRQVEHLLRQSTPAGRSASTPCVDAEQLAAWAAGSLRRQDAATVERHLADCADCQTMLAVFVESEPVPSAATAPFWQRWSLRWLVAAAAASVAVLVWTVSTREHADVPPEPSTTMARAEPEAQPPLEAPVLEPLPAAQSPAEGAPRPAVPRAGVPSPAASAAPATPAAADAARSSAAISTAPATAAQARREMAAEKQTEALSQAAPASPDPATSVVAREESAPAPLRAEPPPAAAPPATAAGRRFSTTAGGAAGQNYVTMDGITAMDQAVPQHARVNASPVQFSASAQAGVRWRIHPEGRIERSTDRGQTWTLMVLEPLTRITAGSAPAANVCWIVGDDGVVLRSTNGTTFARQPFPETASLTTVVAQDTARATVTTEDGRVFATADGGATWQQR